MPEARDKGDPKVECQERTNAGGAKAIDSFVLTMDTYWMIVIYHVAFFVGLKK